jgi:conjugative transfer pilus assembly protein TraH
MAALEKDFGLNTEQKAKAREMRDRVQGYLHALALEKQVHYSKVAGFNAIATELEQLDRQQRASMPQHVIDMLGQRIALTAR